MLSNRLSSIYGLFLSFTVILLAGCLPSISTVDPVGIAGQIPSLTTSASSSLAPSLTPVPSSIVTPPSYTPTATQTSTTTATPTPTLHPMNIQAMRQTPYPGSDIVIEEELEPGANYSRYIASYQSEGLKIYALLTIPFGEPPETGWPAIIFNHGFIPPDEYRTTERYIAYVDSLARSGYIVFRIDYRGHDRSEGEAQGAYGNPGYTIDVLNAVASIRSYPQADPDRIGMWGHSMGGYLTLRAMVISPDIKAGVIWAGVVGSYADMLRWRRSDSSTPTPVSESPRRWRSDWVELYGAPEDNPDFWDGISATFYLGDISGPLQLHHGTADSDVPIEFSETLYQQLLQIGKVVEYYSYEEDNHNISNYFSTAMARTIEFFDRYLKNP